MLVRGSRVGVIGGSIAGCATAIALERLGCDVQVFERSSGVLRDRGSGIAIPLALRDDLRRQTQRGETNGTGDPDGR